ncbi:unnamed protein product [Spirodela intermedia]|uniref:Uncharacterized protein n=1 Tax=Spirodela intermedia TaxID=51605 RepID=A0A7I8K3G3_SPIIN|nr:unnamed protein product [Spirodela intermedia]
MVKKQGKDRHSSSISGLQNATLREQNVGRKHANPSSMLKMEHLKRLATWAGGEASIPSLGALFGHHLAANAEAEGVPSDRSIFSCQRCETILQPGRNCTVRIERNTATGSKSRRTSGISRNRIVYTCNFCSHRNSRNGTPVGHVKDLLASRPLPSGGSTSVDSCSAERIEKDSTVKSASPARAASNVPADDCPQTPSSGVDVCLSSKQKKKREAAQSEAAGPGKDGGVSGKRRRKRWSSVKEIALSGEREREGRISSLPIPFLM